MAQAEARGAFDLPGFYPDTYKQRVGRQGAGARAEQFTAAVDVAGITQRTIQCAASGAAWDTPVVTALPKQLSAYDMDPRAVARQYETAAGDTVPVYPYVRAEDCGFPDEGFPKPAAGGNPWLDAWRRILYHKVPAERDKQLRFQALDRLYGRFCEHAVEVVVYLVHTRVDPGHAPRACAPSCTFTVRDVEVTFANTVDQVKFHAAHEEAMKAAANNRKGLDAVNGSGEYGFGPYPYLQVTYLGFRAFVRPVLPVRGGARVGWGGAPARLGHALNLKPHYIEDYMAPDTMRCQTADEDLLEMSLAGREGGAHGARRATEAPEDLCYSMRRPGRGNQPPPPPADAPTRPAPKRRCFPLNCDAVLI
eukprot:TRINITY_DN9460_c0_g1_i1.p1 TRINITY_DN9460_c0_g1~~TRINITY_DN9460_c0_g1_i1.p1  ORF type:complete len:364 (+),score=107.60 TRINITY_DN9460_c0_g1_i1:102-1193(+)